MKHKEIEKLIQKSLDRETNAEEEKTLHLHLSSCPDCHRFYHELVETGKQLNGLIELFPEPGFNARILKKLGFRKAVWTKKVAIVFSGVWLVSLVFLAISLFSGDLLNKILTFTPSFVRVIDRIQLIISAFNHILVPFAKASMSSLHPAIGLVFGILILYLLGKTLQKEATCKV
jgi:predicted anti-sigma-YlaC factor YlaD